MKYAASQWSVSPRNTTAMPTAPKFSIVSTRQFQQPAQLMGGRCNAPPSLRTEGRRRVRGYNDGGFFWLACRRGVRGDLVYEAHSVLIIPADGGVVLAFRRGHIKMKKRDDKYRDWNMDMMLFFIL
jgi:hypothetical protein